MWFSDGDRSRDRAGGLDIWVVKVDCPLEELERREMARGDRQVGFARMQHGLVHRYGEYDAEVNTFTHTTEENAERLVELFYSGGKPQAMERIRSEGMN